MQCRLFYHYHNLFDAQSKSSLQININSLLLIINNNESLILFISQDILEVPNPGESVQWPEGRWGHSSVLITTSSGPHLLVVGGLSAYDVWLLDINKRKWKELVSIIL